jgi:hypothetical protein
VWSVTFDSNATTIELAHLARNRPPYGLIFTLGDPDSGTVMVFEKTP